MDQYDDDVPVINEDVAEEEAFTEAELRPFRRNGKRDVMRLPKSYRNEASGIPLGMPPELVKGVRINSDPPLEGDGDPAAQITLDGLSDADIVEASKKYPTDPLDSPDQMKDKAVNIYREAARLKAERLKTAGAKPRTTVVVDEETGCVVSNDKTAAAEKVKEMEFIDVQWDYGSHVVGAAYKEVLVKGRLVVLVVADAAKSAGIHIPKVQNESILLTPSDPTTGVTPLWVIPTGTSFSHNGYTYAVLFVDQSRE